MGSYTLPGMSDGQSYVMDPGCAHPSPLLPLTMLGGSPPSLFLEGIQAPVIGVVPTCYRQGEEREPFISLLKKNNRKCSVHTKVERINEYHQLGAHQWLTKEQGPGEPIHLIVVYLLLPSIGYIRYPYSPKGEAG